jgi:hypothetical protein
MIRSTYHLRLKDVSGNRIEILEPEGISDSGEKTWNLVSQERIRNVVLIKPAGCPSILSVNLTQPEEGRSS